MSERSPKDRVASIASRVVEAVKDDPTNPCPTCGSSLIFGPVRCKAGTLGCLLHPGVKLAEAHHEWTCCRCGYGWIAAVST